MKNTKLIFTLFGALLIITSCTKTKHEYYSNGKLKSEIHYRFGKETGISSYYHDWYPTTIMEVEMKRGKKDGKFIKRYFNNNLEIVAYYKNDIIEGVERQFYLNGNPSLETNYLKGKKNGKVTSWFSDGSISESGCFLNDLFDGEWINYDERGLIVGEALFVEGTGKRTTYDAIGRLQCETNFVKNKKDGLETHYFSSGEIEKTILFKEDRIIEINGIPIENL